MTAVRKYDTSIQWNIIQSQNAINHYNEHVTLPKNLGNLMLSERNQTQKDKHRIILLTGVYGIGKFIAAESRIGMMGLGV